MTIIYNNIFITALRRMCLPPKRKECNRPLKHNILYILYAQVMVEY